MTIKVLVELAALFSDGREALRKDMEENIIFRTEQARATAVEACGSPEGVGAFVGAFDGDALGLHDFKETVDWARSFSSDFASFHKVSSLVISGGEKH